MLICVFLLICASSTVTCVGLREEFTWTRINYEWSNGRTSRRYGINGDAISFPGNTNNNGPHKNDNSNDGASNIPYTYENNVPMGANRWNNKIFVTVPRRRSGVPSTLNYILANGTKRHNVPLIPYPDWDANVLPEGPSSGASFVSVYRVAVDKCDRLWFVDTGLIEIPGNPNQVQPPALVIMDLTTDTILRRHVFNNSLLRPNTNLASVTVDVGEDCNDVFAYIPDLAGYGLIVYSFRENRSWRITHNYFYLEPMAGEFSIGGHNFQWNDGIFSVALSGRQRNGYRDAYFHSMAGTHLYRVSARILKNESLATRSYHGDDFEIVGDRGESSQTSASALDESSAVLFLGLVNQNALACWNTKTPLEHTSIIQKDDRRMIYPCDVKVSRNEVILLTNNMPIFLYGTLNYDEINFRIWIEDVGKAIERTKCARRRSGSY